MPSTNKFYKKTLEFNSAEYDVVLGFFRKTGSSEDNAKAFAQDLFRISVDISVPVLSLLDSLKDKDKMQINEAMAFFLNQKRPNSALIGIGTVITPNYFVARNAVI